MINVIVKLTGSRPQVAEIDTGKTVGDALAALDYDASGYSIKVNGSNADANTTLSDGQTVVLGDKVKGGLQ